MGVMASVEHAFDGTADFNHRSGFKEEAMYTCFEEGFDQIGCVVAGEDDDLDMGKVLFDLLDIPVEIVAWHIEVEEDNIRPHFG